MVAILQEYGPCDPATHGKQAIQMYTDAARKREPYDLITIDIEMPDMSGLDLLRTLCLVEQSKRIKVAIKFVITAESSMDNLKIALKNANAFLVKPIKKEVMIAKLKEVGLIETEKKTEKEDDSAQPSSSPA